MSINHTHRYMDTIVKKLPCLEKGSNSVVPSLKTLLASCKIGNFLFFKRHDFQGLALHLARRGLMCLCVNSKKMIV